MDSILLTIKKLLGLDECYTPFDEDIRVHINSALMTLNQLGVGPKKPFVVTGDSETWDQFLLSSEQFEAVKSFIYLSVKIVFDPPSTSYVLDAYKRQIDEYAWRLRVQKEEVEKYAKERKNGKPLESDWWDEYGFDEYTSGE